MQQGDLGGGEWQHPHGAPHGGVTLHSPPVWAAVGAAAAFFFSP